MPQQMAKSQVGGSERVSPATVCSVQTLLSLIFVVNDHQYLSFPPCNKCLEQEGKYLIMMILRDHEKFGGVPYWVQVW